MSEDSFPIGVCPVFPTGPFCDRKNSHEEGRVKPTPTVHDLVIIGAGPCGLAVAARLCEHTPSAIFTDEEHQRYHWIRKHGRKMSIMKGKGGCVVLARPPQNVRGNDAAGRTADSSGNGAVNGQQCDGMSLPAADKESNPPLELGHRYKTIVLDATAEEWMANWNRLFKLFEITHLRSPMFFHVDPRDRDGLLAYTYERNRSKELREIKDCVGKEVSKHKKKKKQAERMDKESGSGPKAKLEIDERDRKDYYVPSRSLFNNHCECVVNRYGLKEGLIRNETVVDIDFGIVPLISATDEVFTVKTKEGVHYARAVVSAIGAGNPPEVPEELRSTGLEKGACHSNQIKVFPPPNVKQKINMKKQTNVLVIGGGLTSAQLDDMCVRHCVTKVWHIMRGDLKVKPFDVNLEWMGKFKNHEKAVFWSADNDKDRLQQIRTARNGGSITPAYHKILKMLVTVGRVSLHTHTELYSRFYHADTQTWTVVTDPPIPDLPEMDYIYFATGIASDFATLPFFQTMLRKYPLRGHGGFPCLSEDLMWRGTASGVSSGIRKDELSKIDGRARRKNSTERACHVADAGGSADDETEANNDLGKRVPLFVTGRLASLRLGPGAGNLEGARVGAERIAWALQEVLADGMDELAPVGSDAGEEDAGSGEEDDSIYRYCAGIGSRYESLGHVGDED